MPNTEGYNELSARELEVLALLDRGLTYREIADELVIGRETVKSHVAHIYEKLGVHNRVQALRVAREWRRAQGADLWLE